MLDTTEVLPEGDITDPINSMLKRFTLSDKLLSHPVSITFSLKFYNFQGSRTCFIGLWVPSILAFEFI
jgi:hypothetical protein